MLDYATWGRYRANRAALLVQGLAGLGLVAAALVLARLGRAGGWALWEEIGLGLVLLVACRELGAAALRARCQVTLGTTGLRWRGWLGWRSMAWADVASVVFRAEHTFRTGAPWLHIALTGSGARLALDDALVAPRSSKPGGALTIDELALRLSQALGQEAALAAQVATGLWLEPGPVAQMLHAGATSRRRLYPLVAWGALAALIGAFALQ